jgi:alkanesulfonate monooxygenase SsuD/methylene tetrahydromethanopterin reductase-like flavin-dependent oxidoreductase (luciferase family)
MWILVGFLSPVGVCGAQGLHSSFGNGLNGQPVRNLASPGTKAIVLFFTATDCPISNRYIPEIQSLENKFAAQHVVFWYVYPNVGETATAVRQHERDFGAEQHVLFDPDHGVVALAHARVTPEAAVLAPTETDGTLRVLYHGRIDNRYIQIGQQRPNATQFDLERAIEDVLQNRPVHPPDGPPVGCGIMGNP